RLEFFLDFLDDLGGIGAGGLLENDGARGVTVDVRVNIEELRAELDALVLLFGLGWRSVSAFGMSRLFVAVAAGRIRVATFDMCCRFVSVTAGRFRVAAFDMC